MITQIKNIDLKPVKCATFESLDYAEYYIAAVSNMSDRDTRSVLLSIGYDILNRIGHKEEYLLKKLSEFKHDCILTLDPRLLHVAPFDTEHTKNNIVICDVDKSMRREINARANDCSIKVYTLCKYCVMLGLREILETDLNYTKLKNSDIGKDVLSQLDKFEIAIEEWISGIKQDVADDDARILDESHPYDEKFIQMNVDVSSIGLEFVEYEHPMDIGRVDILCKSGDEFVLVEVKKETANTDAIGQVLKYVCTFDKSCKGMIIAERFTDSVIKAANDLHIDLVEYHTGLNDDMTRYVKINRL